MEYYNYPFHVGCPGSNVPKRFQKADPLVLKHLFPSALFNFETLRLSLHVQVCVLRMAILLYKLLLTSMLPPSLPNNV